MATAPYPGASWLQFAPLSCLRMVPDLSRIACSLPLPLLQWRAYPSPFARSLTDVPPPSAVVQFRLHSSSASEVLVPLPVLARQQKVTGSQAPPSFCSSTPPPPLGSLGLSRHDLLPRKFAETPGYGRHCNRPVLPNCLLVIAAVEKASEKRS